MRTYKPPQIKGRVTAADVAAFRKPQPMMKPKPVKLQKPLKPQPPKEVPQTKAEDEDSEGQE